MDSENFRKLIASLPPDRSEEYFKQLDQLLRVIVLPQSTVQDWVHQLPRMQQAVLLGAIRGPDGVPKAHASKHLIRWFRRCLLVAAFEGVPILDMNEPGGGDFTGPVPEDVNPLTEFFSVIDELPYHYVTHFVWAAEILGYQHPEKPIARYWMDFYQLWCRKAHVQPETMTDMNARLSDNETRWRKSE